MQKMVIHLVGSTPYAPCKFPSVCVVVVVVVAAAVAEKCFM